MEVQCGERRLCGGCLYLIAIGAA